MIDCYDIWQTQICDNTNMFFLWIFHLESSHHNLNVYFLGLQHDQHLVMSNLSFSHTTRRSPSQVKKYWSYAPLWGVYLQYACARGSMEKVEEIAKCKCGTLTESNDAQTKLLWLDFLEKLNPCAGIASPWALSAQINTPIPILCCMLMVVCFIIRGSCTWFGLLTSLIVLFKARALSDTSSINVKANENLF